MSSLLQEVISINQAMNSICMFTCQFHVAQVHALFQFRFDCFSWKWSVLMKGAPSHYLVSAVEVHSHVTSFLMSQVHKSRSVPIYQFSLIRCSWLNQAPWAPLGTTYRSCRKRSTWSITSCGCFVEIGSGAGQWSWRSHYLLVDLYYIVFKTKVVINHGCKW